MRNVRVTMDEAAFQNLKAAAIAEGFPGIASLLLHRAGVLTPEAEAAEIVKKAIFRALREHEPGDTFMLKDLFEREAWEVFPKGARISAGRRFYDAVEAGIEGIAVGEKTSSNHQTYLRTDEDQS